MCIVTMYIFNYAYEKEQNIYWLVVLDILFVIIP